MDADGRSYGIAAVGFVCGLVGVVATWSMYGRAPSEPTGEGFGTFLLGIALLVLLAVTLAALGEAAVLAGMVRWRDLQTAVRRLLEAGTIAGGLAVPLEAMVVGVWQRPGAVTSGELIAVSSLLAGLGLLCTGVGVLAAAVGPPSRTDGRLLGGTLVAVLFGAAAATLPGAGSLSSVVTGAGGTYVAVGLYCLVLAGSLAALRAVRPGAAHWPALSVALLAVFVAVLRLLAGETGAGTLAALAALVTLWAFWVLYPHEEASSGPLDDDAGTAS